MTAPQLDEVFRRWAEQIRPALPDSEPVAFIGIRRRGDILARRLIDYFARPEPLTVFGALDITLYRDDLAEIGPAAVVRGTSIPRSLDGLPVLLIDDVLYTGRSVRAALTALADFGRARWTRLAVLIDRGGRELPIQPDFVARRIDDLPPNGIVSVRLREVDGVDAVELHERP